MIKTGAELLATKEDIAKSNAELVQKRIDAIKRAKVSQKQSNAELVQKKIDTIRKTKATQEITPALKSAENWLSPREMDGVISTVETYAKYAPVNQSVYNELISSLQERKKLYSSFKSAEEFAAADVNEINFRQRHDGYTKADVQSAIDRLTTASKLAGIEGETDEVKWLKNYGMNVGYSDVESYDKDIAMIDEQLQNAYVSGQQIQYGDNGFSYIYYTNQKYIDELESKKGILERKKKILEAEIKEKEYDLHRGDTQFETIAAQGNYLGFYDNKKIEHMTDDQKKMFNYLANKFNLEEADKYLNDISPFLNEKLNEEKTKRAQNFSDKFPVLSDIVTLGSQLIDGTVMAPVKFVGSLTGDYEKNWASYDSLTTFTNTIRTDHAQDLSNHFGTEWAGFVYNTVMSIADMGTALAVGGATGKIVGAASSAANTTNIAKGVTQFIMSSEAASQTMTDARQRGLSGIQIAALGVASGTIEALTEKLPLDNLFGAKPSYVKAVVKQIATEGTEEAISNVANTILDEIIAGNQSALKQQISDLMASGMSYQDAANKVLIDKVKEIGMDALAGALSGAIMGGGSVALNKLSTVHFSIPTKYKGDLSSAQTWVADKFQNLKNSTNKKGLGTVVVDFQTMTDAIHKTETADQALTFAAINDIIHKGKVQLDGNVAAIGTLATLNGNTHEVVLTASKMNNGNFWITGITMDGDAVVYDARNYLQQMAESETEQDTADQDEISAKLVDGQDSGFDYDSLNRITQTSGQQAPVSEAASSVPAAQGNVAAMDGGVDNQSPAYEQQKSAAVEGDAETLINNGFQSVSREEAKTLDMLDQRNLQRYYGEVRSAIEHTMPSGQMVLVGKTPELLVKYGATDGPLYLPQTAIKKNLAQGKHALGEGVVYNLPEELNDPLAITGQTKKHVEAGDDGIVVWTNWQDGDGNSIVVPIRIITEDVFGEQANVAVTVFDVHDEDYATDLLREGNVKYTKNNESITELLSQRRDMPKAMVPNASNIMIADKKEVVKEDIENSNPDVLESRSYDYNQKIDYSILELEQTELDVSFLEMNEEERADFAQRFESATGTRVVFDEAINAGGKYKDGVITVNPNKDTPMTVLIHELTHHIEKHPKYADFFEYVFKSEMFASWLKEKGTTLQNMRRATIALRAEKGHPLGASGDVTYEADQEILGYFLGQKVFRDMNVLSELVQRHRGFFEWIRDFIANIVQYFRNTPMERELNRIQQMFAKVLQGVNVGDGNVNGSEKHSIVTLPDGRKYVKAERQVIFGNDPAQWEQQIIDYVNDIVRGGNDMTIPTQEGEVLTINGRTAWKLGYRNDTPSGKIDDATYRLKGDAAGHIDELAEASTLKKSKPNFKPNRKMPFGKDGFDYRTAYFLDKDNSYYQLTISVGIDGNTKTVYNIGDIKKVPFPVTGSKAKMGITPSDKTVSQNETDVNTQYMQDGEKYSVSPVLDAEETAQEQSNLLETREQTTVEQATDELLFEEIRRRYPQLSPIDIARLKPEDAVTTPTIKNSTVRNVTGDGDSSFYDSLQNADIFNDGLKTLAASNSTIMQYDRIGNQETLRAANNEINRKGRRYVGEFLHKESTEFTAQDVAAGFILMGRYNAVGDNRGAVMIAEKLREVGTKSGQTVQAFSILGRLTPEGMQLYAQRELHKAYETMLKEQTNKWGRENKDKFKLTDEDIEFIRRKVVQAAQLPDGRDKYVRLGEIAARIQSKIPQQKGQSFKAWQRTAMLLNPKTQIRNITGNLFAMPQFIVSDFIGTGLDKMISKSTGVRTKSGVHLSAKAFAEGLFNSWDDFVRHINTRNFENGRFEIEGHSLDNFSDRNAFTRALNKLDRFNSFLLEAGDRSFYQMWFINSLNGQMKANHVTEPTAAMIEIATDEALERTWQDDNKVSKSVSGLKRIMNNIHIGGYGLGDVVIKFSKTPANLTKAIFDFSPAGLVKALSADAYKFSQAVRDGKATPQIQRTFVKNLSNGITGTLMTFIAMAVAKAGLLTGDKDEDKDVADFEKYVKGHQPYSVKIGNSSFTYDWAQPTAALMAIAADYFENKQNEELTGEAKGFVQNIIDAIQVGGQVLYNQSFMKSIQNLFGNDGFWSGLIDTIIQDPSAMLPQALSQVAAVFDPVIRNTYENGSEAKTAVNKVLYKLPVARNTLAESVDVMGNTKMQHGSIWNRIFNNSLNPANVVKGYDSAAADEVYRLYQVTGSSSVIPSQAPNYVEVPNGGKRTLSSHEKADYQKATGKMITEAVNKLLANERYRGLSDDTKVELLGKVYSYSKQSANSEVLGIEMNESAIKAHDVISQGLPLYEYFLLKQVADENDNGAISQEEARAALDASGLTKTQKSIMWKAFNSGWKSNPYGKRYY